MCFFAEMLPSSLKTISDRRFLGNKPVYVRPSTSEPKNVQLSTSDPKNVRHSTAGQKNDFQTPSSSDMNSKISSESGFK